MRIVNPINTLSVPRSRRVDVGEKVGGLDENRPSSPLDRKTTGQVVDFVISRGVTRFQSICGYANTVSVINHS